MQVAVAVGVHALDVDDGAARALAVRHAGRAVGAADVAHGPRRRRRTSPSAPGRRRRLRGLRRVARLRSRPAPAPPRARPRRAARRAGAPAQRAASRVSIAPRARIVLAALAGSIRRSTTASSSSATSGSSCQRRLQGASQPHRRQAEHLVAQVAAAALGQRPLRLDERAVLVELLQQLLHALAAHRLGLDDRDVPALLRRQRQHALDLPHHRVGERVVGLVDDDHVRDLHHPGLERLDRVAGPGDQHEHDRVRVVDHVDLRLPDPDGLQEHVVLAGGVHQQRGLQRRLRQPAERAAGGHRADEHAGVEEVLGQPDPVAEQRAAAERRARVDRQHGDLAVLRALVPDQRADQRRLAGAGRPGEADHGGVAGARVDLADELPALGVVVLDERDRARQCALVAGEQALGETVAVRQPWSRTRIRSVDDGDDRQAANAPARARGSRPAAGRPARAPALHARATGCSTTSTPG